MIKPFKLFKKLLIGKLTLMNMIFLHINRLINMQILHINQNKFYLILCFICLTLFLKEFFFKAASNDENIYKPIRQKYA